MDDAKKILADAERMMNDATQIVRQNADQIEAASEEIAALRLKVERLTQRNKYLEDEADARTGFGDLLAERVKRIGQKGILYDVTGDIRTLRNDLGDMIREAERQHTEF